MAVILLFYILQINCLYKRCVFFQAIIMQSAQKLSCFNIVATLKIRAPAMVLLLSAGNCKVRR